MSNEGRRRRRIWATWAALLGLLASTTFLAYMPLGSWSLPISLVIALAKALLIMALFMELATAMSLTRVFAAAGFFWLGILLALPAVDYMTRGPTILGEHQTEGRQGPGEPRSP